MSKKDSKTTETLANPQGKTVKNNKVGDDNEG